MELENVILEFASGAEWEQWLAHHHTTSKGVWLLIGKKGTVSGAARQRIHITEVGDVALCFGWIDSQRKGYEEACFLQRYSPRGAKSPWSKGLGGGRQLSMFQIDALVSQGYIVVGIDQPGASAAVRFPDGRVIAGLGRALNPLIDQSGAPQTPTPTLNGQPMPDGIMSYFAQDASFALDAIATLNQTDPHNLLTGHMDLDHVGLFGISLGAIAGSQACATDPRFKACLLMDGFVTADALRTGLQQPTLWITRPADSMRLEREWSGGWAEKDIAITLDTMRAAYEALPGEGYYVEMPTMFHVNFTDVPYYSPLLFKLGLIGPIDPQRGFDIVNAYSVAFFDKVLKGKPSAILEGQAFPEAHLESRMRH